MEGAFEVHASSQPAIIGRETELEQLEEFVASGRQSAVIVGGPGIGKTTLWEAGLEAALEHGLRVVRARPSDAEAQLSFAALTDLFQGVETTTLAELPSPQLRALEIALLRAEPVDSTDPRAVALALLGALQSMAERQPLLVAIDDLQWLDSASAEALTFAARRLMGMPVRFLLARRPETVPSIEQELDRAGGLERLELGPLSFGATRRLLFERLGLTPPRWLLRRVFEITGGNPLFLLELGRTLVARGRIEIGEDIPVPEVVEDLLGTRVASLPRPQRRLLHSLALTGDLDATQLTAIVGDDVLDEALVQGLVILDDGRVRLSHPLLGAAAKGHASPGERRRLHLALAEAADGPQRARHLALAAEEPDPDLADTVGAAAQHAAARGGRQEAVELAEQALRLTPPESDERGMRILALAEHLEVAGERQRVTDLLLPELEALPPGAPRVRALLHLSEGGGITNNYDHERYLERALEESEGIPIARAHVLGKMAINATACCAGQVPEAEAWALEALPAAPEAGVDVERFVLHGLAWARALSGRPIDDLCERFAAVSDAPFHITDAPDQVRGLRFAWRGDLPAARAVLGELLRLADERGEAVSYALQRMNLCEVELRAGEWEAATRLLDEWAAASERLLITATYDRSRALLAAGQGRPEEAEELAASALTDAEPRGYRWQTLEALRARGLAALLAHEPERAAESLGAVWAHMNKEGVDDPGVFPVAADLGEALATLERWDEAAEVVRRLRRLADEQEHPWGRATARRCEALVQLSDGAFDENGVAGFEEAAAQYGRLGFRFDRARTMLALGRVQRRHRKWAAARASLEQAAAAFDEMGSPGWAAEARLELGRLGGRKRRASEELTPSERRVADLAAAGRSNKEIANELFVGVHTVEVHLSHAYAKLGINSRNQLAARLGSKA